MCLSALFKKPDPPKVRPLPRAPTPDDDAVRQRKAQEAALLSSQGGTTATVKTDLAPSSLYSSQGKKRVMLGV